MEGGVTLSVSLVWQQWAGRQDRATPQWGCGRGPVAGRIDGRPCCTHHRGSASHRRLEEIKTTVRAE